MIDGFSISTFQHVKPHQNFGYGTATVSLIGRQFLFKPLDVKTGVLKVSLYSRKPKIGVFSCTLKIRNLLTLCSACGLKGYNFIINNRKPNVRFSNTVFTLLKKGIVCCRKVIKALSESIQSLQQAQFFCVHGSSIHSARTRIMADIGRCINVASANNNRAMATWGVK